MKKIFAAVVCLVSACSSGGFTSDADLAEKLAAGLSAACPMSAPDDEAARNACSAELTDLGLLRDMMASPFLWGGQQETGVWDLSTHVTRFDPRVFRRMYMSLYSFPAEHTVEKLADGKTVLHLKPVFRNKLDMGSYPYPFWHRASKWESYQLATELGLIIEKGKILGALRGFEVDSTRVLVNHEWSGQWTWKRSDQVMPFVTLYGYLFSKANPNVAALDSAYRLMEQELRNETCLACHSPDNAVSQAQLELFSYPNQALTARHRIVTSLENNTMPVADVDRGIPAGISDNAQRARTLALAKKFADLGDAALLWEGENVPKQ